MFNVTLEPVTLTTHHDTFYNLSLNCDNKHLLYLYLLVGTNTYRTPNETTYRVLLFLKSVYVLLCQLKCSFKNSQLLTRVCFNDHSQTGAPIQRSDTSSFVHQYIIISYAL